MNFNIANKLLKKIKNYRDINDENYKNIRNYAKWLFIELQRQNFNDKILSKNKKGVTNARQQ